MASLTRGNYCLNACERCHKKKLKCDKPTNTNTIITIEEAACSQCLKAEIECKVRIKKKPGPKTKNKNLDDNDFDNGCISPPNTDDLDEDDVAHDYSNAQVPHTLSPISPNYSSSPIDSLVHSQTSSPGSHTSVMGSSNFPFHPIEIIEKMSLEKVRQIEPKQIYEIFHYNSEGESDAGLGIT
ncbi:17304_t:CDS:2, partial [Acaulospora morrowiae]